MNFQMLGQTDNDVENWIINNNYCQESQVIRNQLIDDKLQHVFKPIEQFQIPHQMGQVQSE